MSGTSNEPRLPDRAAIEALIPHAGAMCLLDRVVSWSDAGIVCAAANHRHADHPLRSASGLLASAAIEYAAQASAIHGGLLARAAGARIASAGGGALERAERGAAPPGLLASARDVRLARWRLDDLPPADPDELLVTATRQAGDAARVLYAFRIEHGGREVASGRLAVVLRPSSS